MADIDEIREFFSKDRFATENGMYIEEVGEGYAKCSLEITERHLNAMGALMGGVTCTLADFAFAVAANHEKKGTVSLNSNISFLSAPRGKKLFAEAKKYKEGRTTCCYSIDVYDENNTKVAAVMTTGFHII